MVSTRKKTKYVTLLPKTSNPAKQVTVLEAGNTDLLPQESIRSEVNFLTLPFFTLSRHDKRPRTEYHATETRGDKELEVYWKVAAHQDYGYPGVFDSRVHKAIEYIISEMKPPIQNPVPIGSLYGIAKLLGLPDSGKIYRDIKAAIRRIAATTVESKGTFYSRNRNRKIDTILHLYNKAYFVAEELPNGEVADTNYLELDSWYLDNINNRYVKPLDYSYYRTLKSPIASRLYELLGVKFYGMRNYPYIRYRYSNLCQLLPLKPYQYLARVKQQLEPAHQELARTGFLDKVEWDDTLREAHDWYVTYYPGTRAKEEIQRFSKQVALPPPDDPEPRQATAPSTPQQADEDNAVDDVVAALQNFGISKKQAVKLAKEHEHEYILEKLELVQWFRDTKSLLVAKNPAGFARRAIEEDYPAPPQYKSKNNRLLKQRKKNKKNN